ncbi:MAG: YceH family protein [Acidobacteria bacterium]|nr:YceH family protein [Acidobacteriota bacterium]
MTPLPRALDPVEMRILGALLEKAQTTPDYYPLTVSALVAACNQKSNREPVMELGQDDVLDGLESLRRDVLAWRSEGARSERWSEGVTRRLHLEPPARAVLTLLLLRGPQTAGELRARSDRMASFGSLDEVHDVLAELATRAEPVVVELARRPGQKETRWAHLLGGEPSEETGDAPAADYESTARPVTASRSALEDRLAALEDRIESLEAELAELRGSR